MQATEARDQPRQRGCSNKSLGLLDHTPVVGILRIKVVVHLLLVSDSRLASVLSQ